MERNVNNVSLNIVVIPIMHIVVIAATHQDQKIINHQMFVVGKLIQVH